MIVKAKHWLNVDGTWHGPNEQFEVGSVAGIRDAVEVIAETNPAVEPEMPMPAEKPAEKAEKKPEAEVKPVQNTAKRRGTRKA